MRMPRIKQQGPASYHILSRVVDRRRIFNAAEKDRFVQLMRRVETFSGTRVLSYAVLGNHWHILLHVPEKTAISDEEFLDRLHALYAQKQVRTVATQLSSLRASGRDDDAEALRARYMRRMEDVSEFAKTLKQRFSQSYNERHGRAGTLWEGRFKSVLLEQQAWLLAVVAAYIDLNPVRAGLATDPGQYRWCAYADAATGLARAQDGYRTILAALFSVPADWSAVDAAYRQYLAARAAPAAPIAPSTTCTDAGAQPLPAPVDSTPELARQLRQRLRCMSDGLAIGSTAFLRRLKATRAHNPHTYPWPQPRALGNRPWGHLHALGGMERKRLTAVG